MTVKRENELKLKTPDRSKIQDRPQGSKTRIEWIDIFRGLMMFPIIYGHITESPLWISYLYSFHVPAFFVISGMTMCFEKETSFLRFARKRFIGLMIPYFLLNLYVSPLRFWLQDIGQCSQQSFLGLLKGILISNADSGFKMASNTLWFIPCMFLGSLLFYLLLKVTAKNGFGMKRPAKPEIWDGAWDDFWRLIIMAAILTAGLLTHLFRGPAGPWHWKTAIITVPFFFAGYLFMKNIAEIKAFTSRFEKWVPFIIAGLIAAGIIMSWKNGYVSMIHNKCDNYALYFGAALTTSFGLTLTIMKLSERKGFLKGMGFAHFIGKQTLPYIAVHVPLMKLIVYYLPFIDQSKELHVLLLSLALYFGLMPLAYVLGKICTVNKETDLIRVGLRKLCSRRSR